MPDAKTAARLVIHRQEARNDDAVTAAPAAIEKAFSAHQPVD
jgi:hypothetical protein